MLLLLLGVLLQAGQGRRRGYRRRRRRVWIGLTPRRHGERRVEPAAVEVKGAISLEERRDL